MASPAELMMLSATNNECHGHDIILAMASAILESDNVATISLDGGRIRQRGRLDAKAWPAIDVYR